ncbi:MAG: HAMP domain-containing protein [Clostridia bacterium]|nr:HAMP domain-containing protein [Clostridia bacterium]
MAKGRYERPLSIGTKMLISHLVLCVVIIVLASLLSFVLTAQYMKETRMKDLLEKAERIAESSRQMPEGEYVPSWRTVRTYAYLTDAQVFFLDADTEAIRMSWYRPGPEDDAPKDSAIKPHQRLDDVDAPNPRKAQEEEEYENNVQWVDVKDTIDREFVARVLAGEKVSAMRHFEFAQEKIIFAGAPILDEEGVVRSGVILAQPVTELSSLSRMVGYMLVFVVSISLLLSVILAMQLSKMLVSPIKRITLAARRMENGVYAEKITQLPADEIGELGHALNSMSGRLLEVIGNLRRERDRLGMIISGMSEGLFSIDNQWHINHANSAFLELAELDDASRLLDGAPRFDSLVAMLRRCMESGEAETMEWENPSHRVIQATVTARRDDTGAITGVVCLMRDVSETQRVEQLRREYVANVSHELRTPLTGIRGMVEPLIDGCYDTEEERLECYRIIWKETMRLEKLVGEMLDMSRLQDGRVQVELEPLELPGILEAAARGMKPLAEEAGVELSVSTDGTKLACLGNEDRITQVLVILIDNALSFTPRGGSVTVFARDGGEEVLVGVRDTGYGIEPKDLPLIFERFYKVDKSRMGTEGTGLGLSIAKLLTQLMGGDIAVKSEVGVGSEFTFTLRKR